MNSVRTKDLHLYCLVMSQICSYYINPHLAIVTGVFMMTRSDCKKFTKNPRQIILTFALSLVRRGSYSSYQRPIMLG